MKSAAILAAALSAAALSGCMGGWSDVPNPGNPNDAAYAGAPGSVYDAAANPPRNIGQVAYNPYQPLVTSLPANGRLANANTVMSAPLRPPVGSPALGTR